MMEGRFVRTSEELTKKEQSQYKKLKQDELNSLEFMMSLLGINNNNRKEIKKKLHELGSINDALFYYIQKHYIEERMNPKYAKQFIKEVDDIFSEFELEKQKKTYVMDGLTNDNDLVENLLSLLENYRKEEQEQKSSSRQKQKSSSQQKTQQQDQDEDIGQINPGSNIFVNLSSGTTRGEIITRERVKQMKEQQRKAQEQKARVRQKGKQGKSQKGKRLEPQKGKQRKSQKGKREQYTLQQLPQEQYQYQSQEQYDWDC